MKVLELEKSKYGPDKSLKINVKKKKWEHWDLATWKKNSFFFFFQVQVQVLLGKCYTNEFKVIIHNRSILWYSSISYCQDTKICIYRQLYYLANLT